MLGICHTGKVKALSGAGLPRASNVWCWSITMQLAMKLA
jgi:hypothetical protein